MCEFLKSVSDTFDEIYIYIRVGMMEIDQSSCTSVLSVDEETDRDRYQTALSQQYNYSGQFPSPPLGYRCKFHQLCPGIQWQSQCQCVNTTWPGLADSVCIFRPSPCRTHCW
jgi:hypothetical protein